MLELGAFQAVIPFLGVRRVVALRATGVHPARTIKLVRKNLCRSPACFRGNAMHRETLSRSTPCVLDVP